MEYEEFRTWAEKQGWLLLGEGYLPEHLGDARVWLTPAGRAVGVRVLEFEAGTRIEVFTYHPDYGVRH